MYLKTIVKYNNNESMRRNTSPADKVSVMNLKHMIKIIQVYKLNNA